MDTNIIEVKFNGGYIAYVDALSYRYNSGVYLKFVDIELPATYQVHFSDDISDVSIEMVGDENGVLVPSDVFASGKTIYPWIYLHPTDDSSVTKYEIHINKRNRSPLPKGSEPTPSQQSAIDQAISTMNGVAERTSAAFDEIQAAIEEVKLQVDAMKDATEKLNSLVFRINSSGELEYEYEKGGE